MTALSGVVQPAGAYLLTDGASFDADHVVCDIGSKVIPFARQRMAIGWSGYVDNVDDLEAAIAAHGSSQRSIMGALPAIVAQFASSNVAVGIRDGVPTPPVRLLVAMWCETAKEGQLWAIHGSSDIFGSWYVPCTLVRLSNMMGLMPADQAAVFGRVPDYADPARFDVQRDGLRVLEAERAAPFEAGHFAVGGFAELTSVTASGVEQQVLRRWPDAIGERIKPSRSQAINPSEASSGGNLASVNRNPPPSPPLRSEEGHGSQPRLDWRQRTPVQWARSVAQDRPHSTCAEIA